MLVLLIAGMFMDAVTIMFICLPIFLPVMRELQWDPIWFGVLVVSVVEVGLIPPPLGMNLYVIASSVPNLRFETVAAGVVPFLRADFVRIALLVAIPALLSTAVQNPATRRRKTRPGGSGLRHGARAYQ